MKHGVYQEFANSPVNVGNAGLSVGPFLGRGKKHPWRKDLWSWYQDERNVPKETIPFQVREIWKTVPFQLILPPKLSRQWNRSKLQFKEKNSLQRQ